MCMRFHLLNDQSWRNCKSGPSFYRVFLQDAQQAITKQAKQVLVPPVNTCYECEGMLVANHGCKAKYYTNAGVTVAKKVTLRCTRYSVFYNYTQYGNKRMFVAFITILLNRVFPLCLIPFAISCNKICSFALINLHQLPYRMLV